MFRRVSDFDGDGRADFAVTRSEGGLKIWYILHANGSMRQVHWGIGSDSQAAGDYDGDGKTDIAIWRLASSFPVRLDYYALSSQTGAMLVRQVESSFPQWGPIHQDYDGDGRTDPAITSSEVGRIIFRRSTTNTIEQRTFPAFEGSIRIGDMDGDGNSEVASYNFSTNVVSLTNPANGNQRSVHFGIQGDRYVAADLDGDGKGDLTVFRASTGDWWWIRSSDNIVNTVHWGIDGDIAVPADYDGDGRTDLAVYRRQPGPNGIYYVNGSMAGFQAIVWGVSADAPVGY